MEASPLAFEEMRLTAGMGNERSDNKNKHEGRNNKILSRERPDTKRQRERTLVQLLGEAPGSC